MAESLSIEYTHLLDMAKEEDGEIKAATYLMNLNRVEEQHRIHRNIIVTEEN